MACIFYLYCVYSFFYALSAITGSQPMTRSTTPSQTTADTAPLQNTPSILQAPSCAGHVLPYVLFPLLKTLSAVYFLFWSTILTHNGQEMVCNWC